MNDGIAAAPRMMLLGDRVELERGDARPDLRADAVEHVGHEPAGDGHLLDLGDGS